MISRIDPCGVCHIIVKANSVLCIGYQKWLPKRCVKGALKKVEGTFKRKRCINGMLIGRQRQVWMMVLKEWRVLCI